MQPFARTVAAAGLIGAASFGGWRKQMKQL
jgi:hypothetical protein